MFPLRTNTVGKTFNSLLAIKYVGFIQVRNNVKNLYGEDLNQYGLKNHHLHIRFQRLHCWNLIMGWLGAEINSLRLSGLGGLRSFQRTMSLGAREFLIQVVTLSCDGTGFSLSHAWWRFFSIHCTFTCPWWVQMQIDPVWRQTWICELLSLVLGL